jgi:hypothetical protein
MKSTLNLHLSLEGDNLSARTLWDEGETSPPDVKPKSLVLSQVGVLIFAALLKSLSSASNVSADDCLLADTRKAGILFDLSGLW